MMTHSEVNLNQIPADPEISIVNDGKKVHFQVVVGPVVNRKTFKAKHRSKGLDWCVKQVEEIQESLQRQAKTIIS